MKTETNNTKYLLAEACKNTFILLDLLEEINPDQNFLDYVHKSLIKEGRDDSLILVNKVIKNGEFYARMIVFGQDKTFGEFCGNGSRACAAYLFAKYKEFDHFNLVTKRGEHKLMKHEKGIYSIEMPPVLFEINPKFIARSDLFQKKGNFYSISLEGKCFYYAEAIEPHLVMPEDVTDQELFELGSKLNNRRDVFPLGINVNSYHEVEKNSLFVKTYERGVQRLTLSCGTGSSSSTAHYLNGNSGKVKVKTPGGPLEITVQKNSFVLKGPASVEGL